MDDRECDNWIVHLIDTGQETQTGGRVKRLEPWLGDGTFMVTYGDGVCDVDLQELLAFHRAHGRIATVTAVRPPGALWRTRLRRRHRLPILPRSRRSARAGSTAAFWSSSRRLFDYLEDDHSSLEADALERLAADRQLAAYRHDVFWQCMDTLRDKRSARNFMARRDRPLGRFGNENSFWLDRPTLVTGATGLIGGWLVRRLLEAGADVVCLVRDWVPQSVFVSDGLIERVKVVRGERRDQQLDGARRSANTRSIR